MALLDDIKADQLAARKAGDRLKADLLTTLIGEATQITTEEFKRGVTQVTDEKVIATVAKFLKNIKLTLENLATERARLTEVGGDVSKVDGRAKAAETELAILSAYGPRQMTDSELREAINAFRTSNPDANVGNCARNHTNSRCDVEINKYTNGNTESNCKSN